MKFQISYYTPPNQHLRVCGAHEDLGFWNVSSAPKLYETEHGSWECDIRLPGAVTPFDVILVSRIALG